jgi:hypothetical protein
MEERTNDAKSKAEEEGRDTEQQQAGSPGQREPLGASHEQGALGGSVTAAGGSSTGPGAGQAGIDRSPGFIGSQDDGSDEQGQNRDPQQAGFAEQGRGAPSDRGDIERGGERTENFDSDIEGSSSQ